VDVFTDRGTSAERHTLAPKEGAMSYMQFRSVVWARPTRRTMRNLDTYGFVGAVVAIACLVGLLFTTVM